MLRRCPIGLLSSTDICARHCIFLAALCIVALAGGASQVDRHLRLSAWFFGVSTLQVHVLRPGIGVLSEQVLTPMHVMFQVRLLLCFTRCTDELQEPELHRGGVVLLGSAGQ